MPATLAIQRRRRLAERGIGMPGDNNRILDVARKLQTSVEAPVLGGIAVYLHGLRRSTEDLDLYTSDRRATADQLQVAGARWDAKRSEHVLDDVPIHTVTPRDARYEVTRTSIIDGIRTVGLKDLIAIKLLCGLNKVGRTKHIGDVEGLIRCVQLDKRFAGKLPEQLRGPFKKLVDDVRANAKVGAAGRPVLIDPDLQVRVPSAFGTKARDEPRFFL